MNKEQVLAVLDVAVERDTQHGYVFPHGRDLSEARAAIVALYEENERLRHRISMRNEAFAIPHTARDDEWKAVARGNPILAIKICRALHGLGLREAKDLVEAYRSAQ